MAFPSATDLGWTPVNELYARVSVRDWYWRPPFTGTRFSLSDIRAAVLEEGRVASEWLQAAYPSDDWERLSAEEEELRSKLPEVYMPWLAAGEPLFVRLYWLLKPLSVVRLRWKGWTYERWVDLWYYAIAQEFLAWRLRLQDNYKAIERAEDKANLEGRERQLEQDELLQRWLTVRGFRLSNAEFWRVRRNWV